MDEPDPQWGEPRTILAARRDVGIRQVERQVSEAEQEASRFASIRYINPTFTSEGSSRTRWVTVHTAPEVLGTGRDLHTGGVTLARFLRDFWGKRLLRGKVCVELGAGTGVVL